MAIASMLSWIEFIVKFKLYESLTKDRWPYLLAVVSIIL